MKYGIPFHLRTRFDLTSIRIIHHSHSIIQPHGIFFRLKQIEKLDFWQVHHFITYANTNGILTASFCKSSNKKFTECLRCFQFFSWKKSKEWDYLKLNYSKFKDITEFWWYYRVFFQAKWTFYTVTPYKILRKKTKKSLTERKIRRM